MKAATMPATEKVRRSVVERMNSARCIRLFQWLESATARAGRVHERKPRYVASVRRQRCPAIHGNRRLHSNRLPAHDNVAGRASGDLLKRFEQLLPHFKIDLVALGMVEKDLRPLNATAAPLA